MGDISSEPSMEEILSSIKRIIAEEGDAAVSSASRPRRAPRQAPAVRVREAVENDMDEDEVLELREPVRDIPAPTAAAPVESPRVTEPEPAPRAAARPAAPRESIVSDRAAEVSRDKLEALSRMVVRPQVAGADTLEGLVRELLKPMLRDWLDENLPRIVETMVSREIERITGGK